MELNIRKLKDEDYKTLELWWNAWPDWPAPSKELLPEEGRSGLMVEKDGRSIVAGFLYLTNSKGVLLEWIISDPEYRNEDRKKAVELLINTAETVSKDLGYKYMFSIGRNKQLMEMHKKLGWQVDTKPSHEIIKILN
jgi:hypothetical protein|tara:strand:+ start:297 stop:707 length:411 start_codon:yes stop_codon:yes gene_type:complete